MPLTPTLGIAFVASFAGIAYVLLSRNASAKRIVLPITLVIFSSLWFALFQASELATRVPPWLVGLGLVANAAWVLRAVRYCAMCGRTMQDAAVGRAREPRCVSCRAG